jgi:hypothetical protein
MKVRRAVVQAVVGTLIIVAMSWFWTRPSSVADFLIVATAVFLPLFALRLIVDVGGVLLDDERARGRSTP